MKIVAVAAFAIASLNVFADSAKSIPSCEIGVKENKSAIHIQRTMKALEDSTKENPSHVRVLFYGQSIVGQKWHVHLMERLKKKYPTVVFDVENRAIGGYESPRLIKTAESDLYPFYPDILFFHVYGPIDKYEQIIKKTRETTSAEIVLWSSHLRSSDDPKKLMEKMDQRSVQIREIASRYGCMFIDLRSKWCKMLIDNNWQAEYLLADTIHLKSEKDSNAKIYYAGFIGEELCRIKGAKGKSYLSGKIEKIPFSSSRVKKNKDGTVELNFTGNRVVAVTSGECGGETSVSLDGKAPSAYREMYAFTRPSAYVSWMPMINIIERKADAFPKVEDWTLTYIEGTEPFGPVVYKVEGSETGFDGEGRSDADFTSRSGRAVIKKDEFMAIWQYDYFIKRSLKKDEKPQGKYARAGDTITWKCIGLFNDKFTPRDVSERVTLVQNCTNSKHKIILKSDAAIKGIKEFVVYTPPSAVSKKDIVVSVDATRLGKKIPNTSQVRTVWNGRNVDWENFDNKNYSTRDFVEYVELMACTGGNDDRDLLKDPSNTAVLDDYDFSHLIKMCRGILSTGAKPYLKLGNVPAKFSKDVDNGEFSMNIRPPIDHLVHYRYMKACAAALKAEFGLEEVRSWRYAVLTEADNCGWFSVKSDKKTKREQNIQTREEFFKLYDYTAKAFEEELGKNLVFGTHMLNPDDEYFSQFTIEDFLKHCSTGKNAATGGIGSPMSLLTISYHFDTRSPHSDKKGYVNPMKRVVKAVHKAGFTNVVTGVDEGRVICSRKGRQAADLVSRALAQSYQAPIDLRIVRSIVDAGADYFATWEYFSGPRPISIGLPSHHFFTSREFARFAGLKRAAAGISGDFPDGESMEVFAGASEDSSLVRFCVGRFYDHLSWTNSLSSTVRLRLPKEFAGTTVTIDELILDNRNNWFCDWEKDRVLYGIKASDFDWSYDDFAVMSKRTLVTEKFRKLFVEKLEKVYQKKAEKVLPRKFEMKVDKKGYISLTSSFEGNGVIFYTVRK